MLYKNMKFPIETTVRIMKPGESIDPEWKNDLQLVFVKRGEIHYTINGYPNLASTGKLVIINPKQVYHGYTTSSEPVEQLVVQVNYSLLMTQVIDTVTEEVIIPLEEGKIIFSNVVDNPAILSLFHRIYQTLIKKEDRYELRLKSLLYKLIESLLRYNQYYENKAYKRAKEIDSNDITRYVLEYIHKRYSEDISLDSISRHIGISKYHMCRIFKEKTSQTINHYLLNYRLSQAKKQLEETSKNITTISYEVGFNNTSYFIQRFKTAYGVTPNKYR